MAVIMLSGLSPNVIEVPGAGAKMRRALKWIGWAVLATVLAAAAFGVWKRDEITRLLAVNSLFSAGKIVGNFSSMDKLFLHKAIPRGDAPVSALPMGSPATLPAELAGYMTQRNVTAIVVLKNGQVVHESYHLGTGPDDLRISWSVAKSFLSALTGILLDEGVLSNLNDRVTKYAPSLAGSAYDRATIKDVLQMSSGVMFNEDYLDFHSDINRMGRILAVGGSMDEFAAGLTESITAPGEKWKYVSIDTHVLGMVLRGASGRAIPDLIGEEILAPLGLEAEPYYLVDGFDVAFVLGGLNMTTRDYARFGQMIANGGRWNGRQIVPAEWIAVSTVPNANTAPGETGYGYQWWVPEGSGPGQFMARGIYGQYIYIDQPRNIVIALNSADRKFREPGVAQQNVAMFRLIADSL